VEQLLSGWKNGLRRRQAGKSVIFRQQNGRGRPIRLGDDPEFYAVAVAIDRQEAQSLVDRQFVFTTIRIAHVAPIAGRMTAEGDRNVRLVQLVLGVSGDDGLSQGEFRGSHGTSFL
jgi:hypothetical protein